jgi:hypothetical protein
MRFQVVSSCKRSFKQFFVVTAVLISLSSQAFAGTVDLSWDESAGANSYRLYYGVQPGNYNSHLDIASQNTTVSGLQDGVVYYFAVSALTEAGESALSDEVIAPIPISRGGGGESGVDSDGDELSDETEQSLGTNPNNADTDNDSVLDGVEVSDLTDPLDRGSKITPLSQTICADWNGGFSGTMANILELINKGNSAINVSLTLHNGRGVGVSSTYFSIAPGAQYDSLVHGMSGREADQYGKVCISHDGGVGQIDGRMVYYKQNVSAPASVVKKKSKGRKKRPTLPREIRKEFEFAFSMPLSNGVSGSQFVSFNTFAVSRNAGELGFLVANWVQISNLSNRYRSGRVKYFDANGAELGSQMLWLEPGQRFDVTPNQFGANKIGHVAWYPESQTAKFEMRAVRYFFANQGNIYQFLTAFAVEAGVGVGSKQVLSLENKVVGDRFNQTQGMISEISNVLDEPVEVFLDIVSEQGQAIHSRTIALPAHGSYHLDTSAFIPANARGTLFVHSNKRESIIAQNIRYAFSNTGSLSSANATPSVLPAGYSASSSYNTFLQQKSDLVITNTSDSEQVFYVTMIRSNGGHVLNSQPITLASRSTTSLSLNLYEEENRYGLIQVDANTPGAISAWVYRNKPSEFSIPVSLRP